MNRLYALNFRLFVSLKLTILIFIGLGIALFSGMFWDQTASVESHLNDIKNPIFLYFFLLFEMYDVYHSWWFGVLILLLALNLIACSIVRLPKIWKDARNPIEKLNNSLFHEAAQKAFLNIESLHLPLFSKKEKTWKEGDIQYFFYERQRYARYGVYIVHGALLLIMFGSIVNTQFGISGIMNIPEGQSSQTILLSNFNKNNKNHRLNFFVRCNDFRLKTYTDGSPFEYESDLSIYSHSDYKNALLNKTIRVNEPLTYKGYTFYQSSFSTIGKPISVSIAITESNGHVVNYHPKIGEVIQINKDSNSMNKIRILEYYEDYANLGSAIRLEHNNSQFIVFKKYPEFDKMVRKGAISIIFYDLDWNFSTGISVTRSPGISIVFFGFIAMFIGLYVAFGMNQRRYYGKITPASNKSLELTLAGFCYKYPQAFKKEFEQIVNKYKSL